jgi:hypothetical protein
MTKAKGSLRMTKGVQGDEMKKQDEKLNFAFLPAILLLTL